MTMHNSTQSSRAFVQKIKILDKTPQLLERSTNNETFLEILLSQDIDDINKELSMLMIEVFHNSRQLQQLQRDELYIIFDSEEKKELLVQLGSDFISPPIDIPTYNQFHESYQWYKKITPRELSIYTSIDDFVRVRVMHSLRIISSLQEFARYDIVPWNYILLSPDGEDVQEKLLTTMRVELFEVRKNVNLLKETNAPLFMHEECRHILERVLSIVKHLSKKRVQRLS